MRLHQTTLRFGLRLSLLVVLLAGCGDAGQTAPGQGEVPTQAATLAQACPDAEAPLKGELVFGATGTLVNIGVESGEPTSLTVLPQNVSAHDPAWSPDGQTLAFTLTQPSSDPNFAWLQVSTLCAMDRATGKGRMLARGIDANDSLNEATWAPDGKSLLATLQHPKLDANKNYTGDEISIVRYDLTTGQLQPLIKDATSPALSPDGQRLAYIKINPEDFMGQLMLAAPDGQDAKPIGQGQPPLRGFAGPRWAPNNRDLLFTASGSAVSNARPREDVGSVIERLLGIGVAEAHGLPSDIFIVNVETGLLRQVTSANLDDPRAAFGPNGERLAYVGGGSGSVVIVDLATDAKVVRTPQGNYGGIAWAPR